MKLRYEFPAAEVQGRLLTSVPAFLTDDGVSGRVYIDDTNAFESFSHTVMEVRLVGEFVRSCLKF
jgi:hypothetical protein